MDLTQELSVPVSVGDRVTLYEDVDKDDGGFIGDILFEGVISEYNQQTGRLAFEEETIGYAAFMELLHEADGIQIV